MIQEVIHKKLGGDVILIKEVLSHGLLMLLQLHLINVLIDVFGTNEISRIDSGSNSSKLIL